MKSPSEQPSGNLPPDLREQILSLIELRAQLEKLSNEELVQACAKTDAADYIVVTEMMNRLAPGWENR